MKKRILSLLLATLMLVTLAVPMAFAEGEEATPAKKVYTKNVALNKYVYSGGAGNVGANAQKLTNGTYYDGIYPNGYTETDETALLPSGKKGTVATGQQNDWFLIDLGRQYKVKEIKLYSRWNTTFNEGDTVSGGPLVAMQYVEVQGSNTETFDTFDTFIDHEGTLTYDMVPCAQKTVEDVKPYRYIRIQKTGNSYYGFSEIEVFADVVATEVSLNKPVSANVSLDGYPASYAVDGLVKENNTWIAEASKGDSPYWLIVDLEKTYPVLWIEMVGRVIGASENPATRYNWKVFGSKTAPDESQLATDTTSAGELLIPEITGSNYTTLFPKQAEGQLSLETLKKTDARFITFYKSQYNTALSEIRVFAEHPEVYDVTVGENISVSFSDTMDADAVKGAITLRETNGEAVDITDKIAVSGNGAVISGLTLEENKEFVLSISTGAENENGIGLAETYEYEFDTYGTPSVVPYTKTVNKNVAQNKYVYTNSGNAGAKAQVLTDGRRNVDYTFYLAENAIHPNESANDLSGVLPSGKKIEAASSDVREWYMIDLGRQYKITDVKLYSVTSPGENNPALRYMSNIEVQASNTEDFAEYETIIDIDNADADNFPYTAATLEVSKSYRYVRIQKTSRTEHGISEIEIFADINLTEVSRGKEATASASDYGTLPSVTTDGEVSGSWLVENVTGPKYLSVDLEKAYPVSWIEMVARVTDTDNASTRDEWEIYGSDDAPTLETVQGGTKLIPKLFGGYNGNYNRLFPKQSEGYLSMPVFSDAENDTYRYINFYKLINNTALSEVRAFVTAPELIGAYATEDGIAVTFSEAMNPETLNKASIKLYDSEGKRVAWTGGTLSGNTFTIEGAALESGAVYKVEVNNLAENTKGVMVAPLNEATFKNTDDYEITGFKFIDAEGADITDAVLSKTADDVKVKLEVKANAKPVDIMLVMAFYEGTRLADIDFKKVNVKAGTEDILTVTGAWTEETAYTNVKAFLWDGSFIPYDKELEITVQ